jgi:3-methyladenine DNA glycosylase/8-oxoguanine DNA glycosylase
MKFVPTGVRHLKSADPVLRRLIERLGPCELRLERETNQFGALVDAIIYQQLAYRAAQTIERRFLALFRSDNRVQRYPSPEEVLAMPEEALRGAGVSRQKVAYLRDLAAHAVNGSLPLAQLAQMDDEEVIRRVTQVKGIGRWTAEMFLIFCLGRPDVLPVDDLGVQYGFKQVYKLRKLPNAARMQRMAEAWRPYRTVGTWYLWMARRAELRAAAGAKKTRARSAAQNTGSAKPPRKRRTN